ncbi:MAG: cyclic nucleotide-binding domain-containing protein [Desulfocapsaceae bacterium]|nr:cyclic nucleotide-binding domain-containing protein [Desulfocapsaceae bacterium]
MSNLVTEILQLDADCEYLLFSRKGELLYNPTDFLPNLSREQKNIWAKIISLLPFPFEAKLVFAEETLLISQNEIGFIVVFSGGLKELGDMTERCSQVREAVADLANRKKLLVEMLSKADDNVKLALLEELAPLADKEVSTGLVALLAQYKQFTDELRDQLLINICRILGDCDSCEAIEPLADFIAKYCKTGTPYNRDIETEARVSLQQLELIQQQQSSVLPENGSHDSGVMGMREDHAESSTSSSTAETTNTNDNEKGLQAVQKKVKPPLKDGVEQKIKDLVNQGKKQEAVAIIMRYIEAAAQQRMFEKAEKLRDTLIKIDSMMLKEIIRAAEIIEEYKAATIEPEHQEILAELIDMLSVEEFNSLYHSMSLQKFENGESIVEQGAFLPHLFLVINGQVQLYATVNGQEVPLKKVRSGEVIEPETFFEASVWTISVRSLGSDLLSLPRKKLEIMREKHPSLESRLVDYAARFSSANDFFRQTRRSRRRYERKKLSGRASATLLDKHGKETDVSFKGDLFDISRGGVSFCVRVSKKKNAGLLFGKRISISIPSGNVAAKRQQSHLGRIIAVKGHHIVGNEYSLHVEFDRALSHEDMRKALEHG